MMFKVRDLGVTGLNGLNAGVASRQETALKFDFKSGRHWTDLCILIPVLRKLRRVLVALALFFVW